MYCSARYEIYRQVKTPLTLIIQDSGKDPFIDPGAFQAMNEKGGQQLGKQVQQQRSTDPTSAAARALQRKGSSAEESAAE